MTKSGVKGFRAASIPQFLLGRRCRTFNFACGCGRMACRLACAVFGVIALGAAALGHPGGIAAARVEAAPSLSIGDRPGKKLLDAEPPPQGLARKSNVGEETWPGAAMAKFIQLRGTARCNVPGAGPWNRATGLVHDCFVEEEPTGDAPTAAAAVAAAVDSSEEDGMLSEERGRATQSENSRYVSKSLRGVSSSLSSPSPERPSPSARTGGVNADGRTQSAAPLPALGKHIGRETASSEAPTEDCWGGEPPLEIAVEDVRGGDASLGFLLGRLKKMVSDLERQPSLLAAPDSGSFVRDQLLLLIQDTAPPIKPGFLRVFGVLRLSVFLARSLPRVRLRVCFHARVCGVANRVHLCECHVIGS